MRNDTSPGGHPTPATQRHGTADRVDAVADGWAAEVDALAEESGAAEAGAQIAETESQVTRSEAFIKRAGVKPQATGAVYFIQAGENGPIKIGYSNEPWGRLATLQTAHYEKLRLLGVTTGDVDSERALHKRFAPFRLEGEWFSFAQDIVDAIEHSADVIEEAVEALSRTETLPRQIMERIRLGDTAPAVAGLLGLVLSAKNALDALGVTVVEAQFTLDKFFEIADELRAAEDRAA